MSVIALPTVAPQEDVVSLVVLDDDPFYVELARFAANPGFEVRTSVDALRTRTAERTAPGIVLLDLEMPGESGFDVITKHLSELATVDIMVKCPW